MSSVRRLRSTRLCLFLAGAAIFSGAPLISAHRYATNVTWTGEVSVILAQHCTPCHREGGAAPMALTSYEGARPWARAIREEVLERHMPLWPAREGVGDFSNAPTLSSFERELLVTWVDGGAPRGGAVVPSPSTMDRTGTPEPVATIAAVRTNAGDRSEQTSVEDAAAERANERALDLKSRLPDMRANLVELPSDPAPGWTVRRFRATLPVRSCTVRAWTLTSPQVPIVEAEVGRAPRPILGTWVPVDGVITLPPHAGITLRAGEVLDITARLGPKTSPDDNAEKTQPAAVELWCSEERRAELARMPLTNGDTRLRVSLDAVTVRPVSAVRGATIELVARRPDGSREPLVLIAANEPNFRPAYRFRRPVELPRRTVLTVRSSDANAFVVMEYVSRAAGRPVR